MSEVCCKRCGLHGSREDKSLCVAFNRYVPLVRLQFHHDAAAWQTACDEGAGLASLRHWAMIALAPPPAHSAASATWKAFLNWVRDEARKLPEPSTKSKSGCRHSPAEILYFVKKTEKLWLWPAYDPIARKHRFILGRRDNRTTCQKLLNKIGLEGRARSSPVNWRPPTASSLMTNSSPAKRP